MHALGELKVQATGHNEAIKDQAGYQGLDHEHTSLLFLHEKKKFTEEKNVGH